MGELLFVILVIVICFAFSFDKQQKVSDKAKKSTTRLKDRFYLKGSLLTKSYVKYCGGHPRFNTAKVCGVSVYTDGIVLNIDEYSCGMTGRQSIGEAIAIKGEDILSVEMIDQTQITNNPKLANVLAFGVAGMAIGNKDKDELYYLKIRYKYNGIEMNLLLSSDVEKELSSNYVYVIGIKDTLSRTTSISSAINKVIVENYNKNNIVNEV